MRRACMMLAAVGLAAAGAFAASGAPPQSATMGVQVVVDKYVTITGVTSPVMPPVTQPLLPVISIPAYGGSEGTFTVDTNCDSTVWIGDPDDQLTGTVTGKVYKVRDLTTMSELMWNAYVQTTPVGATKVSEFQFTVPKGTTAMPFKVRLSCMTGTSWQAAWADTYTGAVSIKITSP